MREASSSTPSKPSRRYGDKRPDSEIGREILKLDELRKNSRSVGGNYHLALGMQWALEWVTQRSSSPTHKLQMFSKHDTAAHLAKAHDQILQAIDALMVEGSLFEKDGE